MRGQRSVQPLEGDSQVKASGWSDQNLKLPRLSSRSILVLWVARLATAGAGFLTQILLGRTLGLAGYGAFATALALMNLLLPLAGFGVPGFWLRVFGKSDVQGRQYARPTLRILGFSSIAISALAATLALLLGLPASSRTLALVLTALVPSQAVVAAAGAVLQLGSRFGALAICVGLPYLSRLAVAAGAAVWSGTPLWVAVGYAGTAVGLGLAYLPTARKITTVGAGVESSSAARNYSPTSSTSWTTAQTAWQIWPFAFSGFFYAAYFQGSTVLLGLVGGSEAAGTFSAALSVVSLGYLFPAVVYQQYLLPFLNRWLEHDQKRFIFTYTAGVDLMLSTSLAFTGLAAGLGPLLLPKLFGAEFAGAGPILIVLATCLPIRFLSSAAEATLLTEKDMRRRVWCQGIGAAVGTVLILLLAPLLGVWGAVTAMIGSEISVLIGYLYVVRRFVLGGGVLATRLRGRAAFALPISLVAVGGSFALQQHHPAFRVVVALVAVAASLALTKRATAWRLLR